jgi:hexosaminidase
MYRCHNAYQLSKKPSMGSKFQSNPMTSFRACTFLPRKGFGNPWRIRMLLAAMIVATLGTLAIADLPPIIPNPARMSTGEGNFIFTARTTIDADKSLAGEARFLAALVGATSVHHENSPPADVTLVVDDSLGVHGPEAYTLQVTPKKITIKGATAAGVFDGIQSLRQLLPAEVEKRQNDSATAPARGPWRVPCVSIEDYPRFRWRGLMLDVSRHFFTKDEVKQLLDAMALQKLNTFHWHLVDDNGWRIQIKKYPKLTEVGAWRHGIEHGLDPKSSTAYRADGLYGGFYTQDDIREIVAYAQKLHITIIPEIEMPGHSGAALRSYPEFACFGKPGADVYCAGKDATFAFLEDVLAEVFDLFPCKYVHIGGDEVNKSNWQHCAACQSRKKSENLKDEHELQSYFIRRIEKIVNAHGKTLIGWSEIRQGGLAQNAVVMDWIGGAVESAREGHDVVMSPTSHCYFDYSRARSGEPRSIGGFIPLVKVYNFEPIPATLEAKQNARILGAQGNVWTEYIPNIGHVEYMSFPRSTALAEVTWTPREKKDYAGFVARLPSLLAHLDAMGVRYRKCDDALAGAKPVGHWKSGEVAERFGVRSWDVTKAVSSPGNYEIRFQYTDGACRLDIQWAALLINGVEAVRDTHDGRSGAADVSNVYELRVDQLPDGAKVTLAANVRCDGGVDSNGEITISRATAAASSPGLRAAPHQKRR